MMSCPTGAIKVDKAKNTWTINRFDCIQCGYCTQCCPKKCLHINPGYQTPADKKYSITEEHILTEEEKQKAAEAEAKKKAAIAAAMAKKAAEAEAKKSE